VAKIKGFTVVTWVVLETTSAHFHRPHRPAVMGDCLLW